MAQSKTATKSTKHATHRKSKKTAARPDFSEDTVTIDRRRKERRDSEDTNTGAENVAPQLERRKKVNRRRQIDPTTCERDYSEQEVEFMNALDEYKRKSGRMFPTCSEVLEVILSLGYAKVSQGGLGIAPGGEHISAKPMPPLDPACEASSVTETSCQ